VAHGATELPMWRMQQQMIMVAHETINVDLDAKGAVMSPSKARKTCRYSSDWKIARRPPPRFRTRYQAPS